MGKNPLPFILADTGLGLAESLVVRLFYGDKHGHHKNENPGKMKKLSAITTGVTGLISAIFGYLSGGSTSHEAPSPKVLKDTLKNATGFTQKLWARVGLIKSIVAHAKPMKWIKKNPAVSILITTAMGMGFGWLEGVMAEKVVKTTS